MNNNVTLNSPTTRLKTKTKYCDKDIIITLDGAQFLEPSNIKKGVKILGVTGTLEPSVDIECICDVESIDKPIVDIDVTEYDDNKLIYSTVDEKVYQKINGEWVHLDAPIMPVFDDVPKSTDYAIGTIAYVQTFNHCYQFTDAGWRLLKIPNIYTSSTYNASHKDQTAVAPGEYDGLNNVIIKGTHIPTVLDCYMILKTDERYGEGGLVWCETNKAVYELTISDDSEYYIPKLYYKTEITKTSDNRSYTQNMNTTLKLKDVFDIDFKENTLSGESIIPISINVSGAAPTETDINIEPNFNAQTTDKSDVEADFIGSVTVAGVQVVNWKDYTNPPTETGKYYIQPDDAHEKGGIISYGETTLTVGQIYDYDGTNWYVIKPLKSLKKQKTLNTNGTHPVSITSDGTYGISDVEVEITVAVPKGEPVHDTTYGENNPIEPGYSDTPYPPDDTTDGFGTIYVAGVKVINLDKIPTDLTLYNDDNIGELICVDDVIYVYNGTEFVEYVIEYTHPTNLTDGVNQPIEIPKNQTASKVYVTVVASELYDVDKTYNTTPVKLKHKGETLTPETGTVGFQSVTLPDVTILDEPNATKYGDATGYEYDENSLVCNPDTKEVFIVGKQDGYSNLCFIPMLLDEVNFSGHKQYLVSPGLETPIPVTDETYNQGAKKVIVKGRDLILNHQSVSTTHDGWTLQIPQGYDGNGDIAIKGQNVINTDNVEDFINSKKPENTEHMYYLTQACPLTVNNVPITYNPGVYKYYSLRAEDGEVTMYLSQVYYMTGDGVYSIYDALDRDPNKTQNLTFSTQIYFYNEDLVTAEVYITYTNCYFEIDDKENIWYLRCDSAPTIEDSIGSLSLEELYEKIVDIPGFTIDALELQFYVDPDKTELIWDAENTTSWNTSEGKWESATTEKSYQDYYVINDDVFLTDPDNNTFGGDLSLLETKLVVNNVESPTPIISTGWNLLTEGSDFLIEDEFIVNQPIKEAGPYTFPAEDDLVNKYKRFKKFTVTVEVPPTESIIQDVVTLGQNALNGTKVNLTGTDDSYEPGVYIMKDSGWFKMIETTEELNVSCVDSSKTYTPSSGSAYDKVVVPAYGAITIDKNVILYSELKNGKKYYIKPNSYVDGSKFSITVPTSETGSDDKPFTVGNIYLCTIADDTTVTWEELITESEAPEFPIPVVDELPGTDTSHSIGERCYYNGEIYQLAYINGERVWKKLEVPKEVEEIKKGEPIEAFIKSNATSVQYTGDTYYNEIFVQSRIPTIKVTYRPTSKGIEEFNIKDVKEKCTCDFMDFGEHAKDTFDNVLIREFTIDTTSIPTDAQLLDKVVEQDWYDQTLTITEAENNGYDGYGNINIPGYPVIESSTLPTEPDTTYDGKMILFTGEYNGVAYENAIMKARVDSEAGTIVWEELTRNNYQDNKEMSLSWLNSYTPDSGYDAMKRVEIKHGHLFGSAYTEAGLPKATENRVGAIALVENPENENQIDSIQKCVWNNNNASYEWQELKTTYTGATKYINPTTNVIKLSDVDEVNFYEAVDINKIQINKVDVPSVDERPDAEECYNNGNYYVYNKADSTIYKALYRLEEYLWKPMTAPHGNLDIYGTGKYDVTKYESVVVQESYSNEGLIELSKLNPGNNPIKLDEIDSTKNVKLYISFKDKDAYNKAVTEMPIYINRDAVAATDTEQYVVATMSWEHTGEVVRLTANVYVDKTDNCIYISNPAGYLGDPGREIEIIEYHYAEI